MSCINKNWGVTPCGAVESALRLSPSFWHYLRLAMICLLASLVSCHDVPFGIACVLPSYSFALILSDPARAALGR